MLAGVYKPRNAHRLHEGLFLTAYFFFNITANKTYVKQKTLSKRVSINYLTTISFIPLSVISLIGGLKGLTLSGEMFT